MSGSLNGKTAVITGGVRGIGRAIALKLAHSGTSLIVNYNSNKEAAQSLFQEVNSFGGRIVIIQGDVSNYEDARKIIDSALEHYQRLDILVNNAGINRDNLLIRMKEEEFQR
ncbi:MAG TPA: SDR family NAD(P)-dependent oxidoreductase, partial [Atribacterota bacterium]|nr:SDR family NAD(P)-dependent oxidoreductase [Atribacterota bacterium]